MELPKIHVLSNAKIKGERDFSSEASVLDHRLLLLGSQMKKDTDNLRQDKNRELSYQRYKNKKEAALQRKIRVSAILKSFGISEVVFQKRKILTYV